MRRRTVATRNRSGHLRWNARNILSSQASFPNDARSMARMRSRSEVSNFRMRATGRLRLGCIQDRHISNPRTHIATILAGQCPRYLGGMAEIVHGPRSQKNLHGYLTEPGMHSRQGQLHGPDPQAFQSTQILVAELAKHIQQVRAASPFDQGAKAAPVKWIERARFAAFQDDPDRQSV